MEKDYQKQREIANEVVRHLDKINFWSKTNGKFAPITETLRDSWYVGKAIELGHTDCCYIRCEGGFIVVLEDGEIMTGSNVMVPTIFHCIADDNRISDDELYQMIFPLAETHIELENDSIIIMEFDKFLQFVDEIYELQTNKIRSRDVRITFTAEIFLSGTEDEIREQFRNMEFFSEKAIKNKADFVSLVSAEDVITNEEIAIY